MPAVVLVGEILSFVNSKTAVTRQKKKKRGKKVSALTGEEEKTFECLSSPVRIDDFSIFDF